MKRVSLDFYNNAADIDVDGVAHTFHSATKFKQLTGFNFPDALIVSYEHERNLFLVERIGGKFYSGENVPEILWIADNLEEIKQAAAADKTTEQIALGWREERNMYLASTDWMITRHNEESVRGTTTLNAQQYTDLLNFRHLLRTMTDESTSFPSIPDFVPVQV